MKERTITALFVGAFSLLSTLSALAAVPEFGTVVEGQSVPGVVLGDTRALVEATYGEPTRCQNEAATCTWIIEGNLGQGGQAQSQVNVGFSSSTSNDPNDVVSSISWNGLDGWVTTTGINTYFAVNNQDAVIALYPDGIIFNQSLFDRHLTAYENGISFSWHTAYLSGTTLVRITIFEPRDPPPPRELSVSISEINMDLYKRQVIGEVSVVNDRNWRTRGADVYATWTLADGSTQAVQGTSDSFGKVTFVIEKARKGTYTLTIDDLVLEDHPFDTENSVLSATIVKKR